MSSLPLAHSIKVPRLYKAASKLLVKVNEGENIKALIGKVNHPNKKGIMALVTKTLQHDQILSKIFENTNMLSKEENMDKDLASVLVTELLWGKKILQGDSKPVQTVLKYQEKLLAAVTSDDLMTSDECLQTTWRPRYIRINTLKQQPQAVKNYFAKNAWKLLKPPESYKEYIDYIKTNLKESTFIEDYHMQELLLFPFGTVFAEHRLYKNGTFVLQDKASCMATHILAPEPGSTVLDMCAAPGMKTTHLAAMMQNKGKIYACERDKKRYKVLKETIARCGASKCVIPINKDIFFAKFRKADIDYILLDPSCSGTGILNRPTYSEKLTTEENLKKRLEKLAAMQTKLLHYALTHFPMAKRVVYSTCSVYPEENEEVVEKVLARTQHYNLLDCSKIFKEWRNFGLARFSFGNKCIRTVPEVDCLNGFFIAAFERKTL